MTLPVLMLEADVEILKYHMLRAKIVMGKYSPYVPIILFLYMYWVLKSVMVVYVGTYGVLLPMVYNEL